MPVSMASDEWSRCVCEGAKAAMESPCPQMQSVRNPCAKKTTESGVARTGLQGIVCLYFVGTEIDQMCPQYSQIRCQLTGGLQYHRGETCGSRDLRRNL